MKTCSSYEFHSLEGNLGIRGCIYMGLERARHIRGLVCSVTTLLSVLSLLNQVVGLSLDQILALVDAVVRVLAEGAGDRGGTLAVASRCE